MNEKVKPRKLPPIRWVMPPKPEKKKPSPPPDPADFQGGIYVTIDENKFFEFLRDIDNGTAQDT